LELRKRIHLDLAVGAHGADLREGHSSRRAQAISPELSCGGGKGAVSFGEWRPWFLGKGFVALPGV